MLRLGKFAAALLWEEEIEMPTLSSPTGLWAGNICDPLQSSSVNSLWGTCTSPTPPGNTEPLVTGPSLQAGLCKLPTSCLHSRESTVVGRTTGQTASCSGVFGISCESGQLRYSSKEPFHPLSLTCCSKVTTNHNTTAVLPCSLSLSLNSRLTYLNLKTKREKLFNILSWQLSPKPFWMNLAHWSQWHCFHQLQ